MALRNDPLHGREQLLGRRLPRGASLALVAGGGATTPTAPSLTLPSDLRAPSTARQFAKAWCRARGRDASTIDTAVLLVSEIVTNAVLHGGGAVDLTLSETSDGSLLVEVADHAAGHPVQKEGPLLAEGGRGLAIAASLSTSWGVRPTTVGKIVWFTL